MKEQEKYETIRELVSSKGNKKRTALKLGITVRHLNRLILKFEREGKDGFCHHNRNRQPINTLPKDLSTQILNLYQGKYQDCNFSHFKDLLEEREHIAVSYSFIYRLLTSNGFRSVKIHKATKRKLAREEIMKNNPDMPMQDIDAVISHVVALEDAHPRRERKKFFGEEIQMDGSTHPWFAGFKCCLHLAIDNCTGTIVGGYFDRQETLNGYYNVLYQILTSYGIPYAFKTDNRTVFNYAKEHFKHDHSDVLTQFGYACKQLGISLSTTSVSQAKGQIERANGTFQSRLVKELQLEGITDLCSANRYLWDIFIPAFNKKFALAPESVDSVFESSPDPDRINTTLAVLSPRKFDNGSTVKYLNNYYQAFDVNRNLVCFTPKTECLVIKAFNGDLFVTVDDNIYALFPLKKHSDSSVDFDPPCIDTPDPSKVYIPPMSHPWKRASFLAQQAKAHKHHIYT